MSTDIIETRQEKPAVRMDWQYDKSVEMVKPILGRWKSEAKAMIIPELWNAHEHLDGRGNHEGNQYTGMEKGKGFTFSNYCEDIGITRQTGRNWLLTAGLLQSGAHVGNNTGNQENYTPPTAIAAVKQALGNIDLDPASCEKAQEVVQADRYYDEDENGLDKEWSGRVFLNPPYQMPQIKEFTDKLVAELPNIESAIVLTNNNTDTAWFRKCADEATLICFTKGRIKFYTPDLAETAPTNGQVYFYFGNDEQAFISAFSDLGLIVRVVDND